MPTAAGTADSPDLTRLRAAVDELAAVGDVGRLRALRDELRVVAERDAEVAGHGRLVWKVDDGPRCYESHDPATGTWRLTVLGGRMATAHEVVGWAPTTGLPAPGAAPPELTKRYEPRGAARALLDAGDDEVCIAGPAGTGKSLSALTKIHLACLRTPGVRALVVRQTHLSLTSTTLVTYREEAAAEALAAGVVRWYGGSGQEPPAYRFANGSTIVVGGLDKPDKVMGGSYDVIFVDEATETVKDAVEKLVSRLRSFTLPYRQLILGCNPSHPTHWVKQRCDAGGMRMLHSRHSDNPAYVNADGSYTEAGRDYLVGKLGKLTGVRRLRLLDGKWSAAEGVVYEGWDDDIHLVNGFKPPDGWQIWWSIDFGYTNPFCLQSWAEDPDGRLYLYRELYRTQRTVDQHCDDILALVSDPDPENPRRRIWHERKPRAVICDHDAEGREVFRKKTGLSTRPAKKGIADGIQAMQGRLRVAGDGKPRLFVMRDSPVYRDPELVDAKLPTCFAEEILGYVWRRPGVSAASQAPKEEPLQENNHSMDAARYLCAERESGRPGIRVLGG